MITVPALVLLSGLLVRQLFRQPYSPLAALIEARTISLLAMGVLVVFALGAALTIATNAVFRRRFEHYAGPLAMGLVVALGVYLLASHDRRDDQRYAVMAQQRVASLANESVALRHATGEFPRFAVRQDQVLTVTDAKVLPESATYFLTVKGVEGYAEVWVTAEEGTLWWRERESQTARRLGRVVVGRVTEESKNAFVLVDSIGRRQAIRGYANDSRMRDGARLTVAVNDAGGIDSILLLGP